jgi:hypothetical protein
LAISGRSFPVRCIYTPSAIPPVAFDSVGAAAAGLTSSLSWSHSIGSSARIAVAFAAAESSSGAFTMTAKVGTTSMTQVGSSFLYGTSGDTFYLFAFALLNPPTGSQTLSMTASSSKYLCASSMSYINVASYGPLLTNSGVGTALSLSATPLAGGAVAMAFAGGTQAFTSFSQNQRRSIAFSSGSNVAALLGDGSGSTFTCTGSTSQLWGAAGLRLSPT